MSTDSIVKIVAAAAALLSPVIAWLLKQYGVSQQTKDREALKGRIDLIEKLSSLRALSPKFDDDIEKLKYREMGALLAEVESLSETARAQSSPQKAEMSRWKRASLSYRQISLLGRIYKGFFRLFAVFGLSMIVMWAVTLLSPSALAPQGSTSDLEPWGTFALGGIVYFLIALAFRRAAVRKYEADKEKASAAAARS